MYKYVDWLWENLHKQNFLFLFLLLTIGLYCIVITLHLNFLK